MLENIFLIMILGSAIIWSIRYFIRTLTKGESDNKCSHCGINQVYNQASDKNINK